MKFTGVLFASVLVVAIVVIFIYIQSTFGSVSGAVNYYKHEIKKAYYVGGTK